MKKKEWARREVKFVEGIHSMSVGWNSVDEWNEPSDDPEPTPEVSITHNMRGTSTKLDVRDPMELRQLVVVIQAVADVWERVLTGTEV